MYVDLVFVCLVFCLQKEIQCLKDVVLDIDPSVVEKGGVSTLRCSYDTQGAPLYTAKWYRGSHEFYRFTPKEHPSTKVFPMDGIRVDLNRSDEHQVALRDVGFKLSGTFSCEVTTDGSENMDISAMTVSKDMMVVVLPRGRPSLNTDKSFYDIGDLLRANCSSTPSRPPATLTFILNNMVVCERCMATKHLKGELTWSERYLELPLFRSHFQAGRLTLKCIAKIGNLYQQDSEITFDNVKDPVPARVTQSSGSIRHVVKILAYFVFFLTRSVW